VAPRSGVGACQDTLDCPTGSTDTSPAILGDGPEASTSSGRWGRDEAPGWPLPPSTSPLTIPFPFLSPGSPPCRAVAPRHSLPPRRYPSVHSGDLSLSCAFEVSGR